MMDFSQATSSVSAMRSKARSNACLHCRRRKMRCDGVRPACFQCIRADRAIECEYGDDLNKSDTQILYERLASLEKRYRDLQTIKGRSKNNANTRQLRGQSRSGAQLSRSNSVPKTHGSQVPSRREDSGRPGRSGMKQPLSARSSPLTRSDSPTSETSDGSFGQVPYAQPSGLMFGGPSDAHSTDALSFPFPSQPIEEPFGLSQSAVHHLLIVFAAHAQQTGVSLVYECRVLEHGELPKSFIPLFFLWSIHFSKDPELQKHKAEFLDLALDSLSELLREPLGVQCKDREESVYNLLLAIVIHTSLATYFFASGRMLEGNYHANNASQLAICAGLHRTPNPKEFQAPSSREGETSPGSPGAGLLPKPRSMKEALFRHHQFWNMFVLDRSWSAVSGAPSPSWRWGSSGLGSMSSEGVLNERSARTIIKTPWPEDFGLLTNAQLNPQAGATFTSEQPVDDFLAGLDHQPSLSILTLRAKSAALFEASSRISSLAETVQPTGVTCDIFAKYQRTLSSFLVNLPPLAGLNNMEPPSFEKCSLGVTHTMTHAAVIRLNFSWAQKAYSSQPVPPKYTEANQVVMDTLIGYERMLGNVPMSSDSGFSLSIGQSSIHSSMVPTGPVAGKALAAVETCLSSARQIVRIISCFGAADYEFCEPIVACCWDLASQAFLLEVQRLGLSNSHLSDFQNLLVELGVIENALRCLGETFPIGKLQADKLTSHLRTVVNPSLIPP